MQTYKEKVPSSVDAAANWYPYIAIPAKPTSYSPGVDINIAIQNQISDRPHRDKIEIVRIE